MCIKYVMTLDGTFNIAPKSVDIALRQILAEFVLSRLKYPGMLGHID